MMRQTITIEPTAPFSFALTAENQPYYRKGVSNEAPTDSAEGTDPTEAYVRLLDLGDKLALATARSGGGVESPQVYVEIAGEVITSSDLAAGREQMVRLLGADQDLGPFYASAAADPAMTGLIKTFYGLHLPRTVSVYEALVQAILGQQLAASVVRTIRSLLITTFGPSLVIDGQQHYAFPRPAALAEASIDQLRSLKLSRRKAEYLQGIAQAELECPGGLDALRLLSDAEAERALVALRGVGRWTAQWALLRALGRPDAFPVGDLALRRIVSHFYFRGEAINDQELELFSERWAPYRSLATHYLFAALRSGIGRE